MSTFIGVEDLRPFADIDPLKADAMITDAEATAILAAPCLLTITTAPADETEAEAALRTTKVAAVKAILRSAILRWHDAGSGAVQSQAVGPFSQTLDTRVQRRSMFWPSELEQLQDLCNTGGGAFAIDTLGCSTIHQPWCAVHFGAAYCSCGADIAGFPLYEYG